MRIALLLCLFSFFSCTVTKRVHRPGYHIEWNKNYSANAREVATENEMDAAQDSSKRTASPTRLNPAGMHFEEGLEASIAREEEKTLETLDFNSPKNPKNVQNEQKGAQDSKNWEFDPGSKGSYRPYDTIVDDEVQKRRSNARIINGIAIGLIILGLMLFIASLFLVFGFNGLGGLFNSLVFSGNGFFVGLLGFLLFLLILLVIVLFVVIVEFVLGGAYVGFVFGSSLVVAGLVLLLINYLVF